jgi:hypothetical protein
MSQAHHFMAYIAHITSGAASTYFMAFVPQNTITLTGILTITVKCISPISLQIFKSYRDFNVFVVRSS